MSGRSLLLVATAIGGSPFARPANECDGLADRRLEAVAEVDKRGGESRAQLGIGNHNCEGVWHCMRRAVAAGSIGAESQRPEANRLVFCVGLGLHLVNIRPGPTAARLL